MRALWPERRRSSGAGARSSTDRTIGRRELETGLPVAPDTIFRIASMTKPITTVAALMLLEEGRFDLDTPITRDAPELARLLVLRDPEGPLEDVVDAERPITFGDLLTHRSGLTYGEFHRGPVRRAYSRRIGRTIDNPLSPDEWIERLATAPIDRPAGQWISLRRCRRTCSDSSSRAWRARRWARCSRRGSSRR